MTFLVIRKVVGCVCVGGGGGLRLCVGLNRGGNEMMGGVSIYMGRAEKGLLD